MDAWFPQLKKTACASPRLRLVTFPNSGSAENVYTGMDKTAHDGTSGRRENALIKWAKETKVEVLAAQPPGRDSRMREPGLTSAKAIAEGAFAAVKARLFETDDTPWALFAHSMGSWVAFEFALLARNAGLRPPLILVASGFASPSCPLDQRPWTPSAGMSDEEFKEEARGWSINEIVFSESMWPTYNKLLRTDFGCFDQYPEWPYYAGDAGQFAKFDFPVRAFYGSEDKRCTREKVSEWCAVARDFAVEAPIAGTHLFVYDEAARSTWFTAVARAVDMVAPKLLREYVVTGKNGAVLRLGCELTSNTVEPELAKGTVVLVCEESLNSKGSERLHLVSYGDKPIDAWASKKLFEFKKLVKEPVAKKQVLMPPPPPRASSGEPVVAGSMVGEYVVTGKNGALLRAGCELETEDLKLTIPNGSTVFVTEECSNAKGTARMHIVMFAQTGGFFTAVDGWCTAKFLTLKTQEVGLPVNGTKPFVTVFPAPNGTGNVVLFPGQGAQKVGMTAPYLETKGVKAMFAAASKIFAGTDLLDLTMNGPVEKLNDTQYSQVCVFLTSLAAMKKLEAEDPAAILNAKVCAGFSLGEYTALVFAGVMELETAVKLLKVRGEAMAEACAMGEPSGMMTVVGVEEAQLAELLAASDGVTVANQLFPKGRVLSGPKAGLAKLKEDIETMKLEGAKTIVQPVSGAFHSKFMAPAAVRLAAALSEAVFVKPTRVVYSNVTAQPHLEDDVESIKKAMENQLVCGVLWEDTMANIAASYPDTAKFYEPAPGRQLTSMMRRISADNHAKMSSL